MNVLISIFILGFTSISFAKLVQVPEDCVSLKTIPCLIQVQGSGSAHLKMGAMHVRAPSGTILKWTGYQEQFSLLLIKGQFAIKSDFVSSSNASINSLPVNTNQGLVVRENETIEVLDLKSFVLSVFTLNESGDGGELKSSRFLDKSELVRYVSKFYRTKSTLVSFLQTIQDSWVEQFQIQAKSQTNVLARSIASIENERIKKDQDALLNKAKLKKVREEFFYRTFYR